ncbi:MAG: hypothetical protein U0869_23990 [Chloroflexota bacterium]
MLGHHVPSRRALSLMGSGLVLAATLASAAPVGAATSGVVTVTGGSQSTLELTIPDTTAAFGTALAPDATGAGAEVTGSYPGTPGACFKWPGSATVRSNIAWKVQQVAAAANTKVRFFNSDFTTYVACTTGGGLNTTAATWATGTATANQANSFWLSAEVLWTDAPSSTFANASVTLTVSSNP